MTLGRQRSEHVAPPKRRGEVRVFGGRLFCSDGEEAAIDLRSLSDDGDVGGAAERGDDHGALVAGRERGGRIETPGQVTLIAEPARELRREIRFESDERDSHGRVCPLPRTTYL